VLLVWRANLFASSMKGHEYLLKHLLGTDHAVTAPETPPRARPAEVVWREEAPQGKLDLSVAVDFRMTSTCLYSDIVLPAATWYEKHDLSSTDMHRSCTRSTRPSHRRGRPAPTSTRSRRSRPSSPGSPPPTWGCGTTWSPRR
jgi:nitrate reductase alpha subunit